MERKKVTIKKESKIKKNEESQIEISNAGFICTTRSEILSESSLIETETITDSSSVDIENSSGERRNDGSTTTKRRLDVPTEKDDSIRGKTLDNFGQMKDFNAVHCDNPVDIKPLINIGHTKAVNLKDLHEMSSSPKWFPLNPTENSKASEKEIIVDDKLDCPSNESVLSTNKDLNRGISDISPKNYQESEESQIIKLASDGKINVPNANDNPMQISNKGDLHLDGTGIVSNMNARDINQNLRSRNLETKNSVNSQNRNKNINERKVIKGDTFLKKADIFEQGDSNLILPAGDEKNNNSGVNMGKNNLNKTANHLVNYFEKINSPKPAKTNLKTVIFSSGKRKLPETTNRQKRKLTKDQNFPNKKSSTHDTCLPNCSITLEDCTRKRHLASKNFGLLKESKEDIQSYTPKTAPNFNFNDDSAKFCIVKCSQTQTGLKTIKKTPRQPSKESLPFAYKFKKQTGSITPTPKTLFRISPDSRIEARGKFCQPTVFPVLDDSSAVDDENDFTSGIEPTSFNDKTVKFSKSSEDEPNLQKSNLALKKKICMNNDSRSKRHLIAFMSDEKVLSSEEQRDKSVKNDETSFVSCLSSVIFYMIIFAIGIHYQFFK